MILNIRGTSGSGKSHVVRELMKHFDITYPLYNTDNKVIGYRTADGDFHVLGKYTSPTGGIDATYNAKGAMNDCERVLRCWATQAHVVFEGLTVSSGYGRWAALCAEAPELDFTWAFLDTPLQQCYDYIQQRNGGKPLRDPTYVSSKWAMCRRHAEKAKADGFRVVWLPWQHATREAIQLLQQGGPA